MGGGSVLCSGSWCSLPAQAADWCTEIELDLAAGHHTTAHTPHASVQSHVLGTLTLQSQAHSQIKAACNQNRWRRWATRPP